MSLIRLRPKLLRRDHLKILMVAMDAVQDELAADSVLRAAERFFRRTFEDGDELERYLHDEDAHSQFFPWLLWDAGVPNQRLGAKLVLRAEQWGPAGIEVLDALLRTDAELYQVLHASDRLVALERLRDGHRVALNEPVLQSVVSAGELLVARVLELRDCSLLDAVHSCLPTSARRGMVRAARRAAKLPDSDRLPALLAAEKRAMSRIRRKQAAAQATTEDSLVEATSFFRVVDLSPVERALSEAAESGVLQPRSQGGWIVPPQGPEEAGAVLQLTDQQLRVQTTSLQRAESTAAYLADLIPGLQLGLTVLSLPSGLLA